MIQKQQFTNNTLLKQLLVDVLQDCWCCQRWALKISQISLENTCVGYNMKIEVWFYAFSQHLYYKKNSITVVF